MAPDWCIIFGTCIDPWTESSTLRLGAQEKKPRDIMFSLNFLDETLTQSIQATDKY